MPTVTISHQRPPIPTRIMDYRAGFDGREEEGKDGWGPTPIAAVVDLMQYVETIEDAGEVILAALRADLADMLAKTAAPAAHANIMRIAYERAIATVEGIL